VKLNFSFPVTGSGTASVEYSKKEIRHVIRIEFADFKPCTPREVRRKKRLVSEEVYLVHFKNPDIFTIKQLK